MINCRYTVLKLLGEGGAGEVFLAQDLLRPDAATALKVLKSAGDSGQTSNELFQNEITHLLKLTHPNLLQVFDFGIVRKSDDAALRGRPFYAMEVVEGLDVFTWTRRCIDDANRESHLFDFLLQALSVLSYVHREGVIHFDIKPENFIVAGGVDTGTRPTMKLTDFGFSQRKEDSIGTSLRGTLEYTAPELLQGLAFDHRIDLYSLGVTFFQLLEGRCPFEAKSPVELVKLILNEPVAFSPPATNRGKELHAVVAKLMQQRPEDRFASADEAARALVREVEPDKNLFNELFGFLRKAGFVGRTAEREQVEALLQCLVQGTSDTSITALTVAGSDGMGKTAFLARAARSAKAHGLYVIEVPTARSGIPYSSICTPVAALRLGVKCLVDNGEKVTEKVSTLIDAIVQNAGERQGINSQSSIGGYDGASEHLARFLVESSRVLPTVLIVDDFPLMDKESVEVIRMAVRDSLPGRFLVVAGEATAGGSLPDSHRVISLQLSPLSLEETVEMSSRVFHDVQVAAAVGRHIYKNFGGTPAVLVEALFAAAELTGVGAPSTAHSGDASLAQLGTALPRTLGELVIGRFQKLPKERQLVLGMLSCFQDSAPLDLLAELLPFRRERLSELLQFLQLDGCVGFTDDFLHASVSVAVLKQHAYSQLGGSPEEFHKVIAVKLEGHREHRTLREEQELAHQWARAGEPFKAAQHYETAAEEAMRLHTVGKANELLREALTQTQLINETAWGSRLRNRLAAGLLEADAFEEAIAEARLCRQTSGLSPEQEMELFRVEGQAMAQLGRNEEALHALQAALERTTDPTRRLLLEQERIGVSIALGNFKEAETNSLMQLECARAMGNNSLLGTILTDLGIATFYQNMFSDAAVFFSESLEAYERTGDKTQIFNALNNIGNAWSAQGEFGTAIEYWDRALKGVQDQGSVHQQALIHNNLGIAYYNLKRFDEAKTSYNTALEIHRHAGSKTGVTSALINLGEVSFAEADYEVALHRFREARDIYVELEDPHGQVEANLHLANVWFFFGASSTIRELLAETESIVRIRQLNSFQAELHYVHGMLELSQKQYRAAIGFFEDARRQFDLDGNAGKSLECAAREIEALYRLGDYQAAVSRADAVSGSVNAKERPQVAAELQYWLALVSATAKVEALERPLVYLKHGVELLEKEPVSELTWRLLFALGREYHQRGQMDKAREFLTKTKLVVEFMLSRIGSAELKRQYITVDDKERLLGGINAILTT